MDVFETSSSILMLVWGAMGILCALLFILLVSIDRRCHTLTILLVLNSTVAGLLANIVCISQAIYQLMDVGPDPLCAVRGLLLQAGTGLLYHTLCVQALYRLFVTVYSTRRALQTRNFIVFLIVMQWIILGIFGLPMLLMGRIRYYQGSRICQVSLEDKLGFFYFASMIFLLPLLTIGLIYLRIVKYMKTNRFVTTHPSTDLGHHRQRSELRLIRRILMLVLILFVLGFPYFFFFVSIQLHLIPSWPFAPRVSYLFITFGQSASIFINLITTDPVRKSLMNRVHHCGTGEDQIQRSSTH